MSNTIDDLPLFRIQRSPTSAARTRDLVQGLESGRTNRRTFLAITGLTAVATVGLQLLKLVGGQLPANATPQCELNLSYKSTCGSGAYATTCSDGCARHPDWDSYWWCWNSSIFLSRHRTCLERKWWGSQLWDFELRVNECYGSGHDGWVWINVDSGGLCGCQYGRRFGCTDGYGWYMNNGVEPWYGPWKTICQTVSCSAS